MAPTTPATRSLQIFIDSKAFTIGDTDQEAASLLRLAGRDPKIFDLFLVKKNDVEEKLKDDEIINLRDAERFVSRQHVRFTIDGESFRTYDDDQTAADLLRLAGVDPAGYDLARVGAAASFPDEEIVTIVEGDEFVTAKHVGGVA
ncbi:hypothetical protein G3T36_17510 [Diaminobutyricibacter tongyongensis]|uniref:Multi-ubiquitin domain-containing protein n=1 Tax=Leifsonia tongyongensis TaxID=1268043 RepID=A0A6L9Y264_9MICO|nr:hypothetical protein [Diaminobutyricibacter tongyongensis]NEN07656.1 hypothetical protein [Diaminobutyricibacter tongyongensis]